MAVLARYGNVQPSEYDDMDHRDACSLAVEVYRLHDNDQELTVELAKAQIKASGATIR